MFDQWCSGKRGALSNEVREINNSNLCPIMTVTFSVCKCNNYYETEAGDFSANTIMVIISLKPKRNRDNVDQK